MMISFLEISLQFLKKICAEKVLEKGTLLLLLRILAQLLKVFYTLGREQGRDKRSAPRKLEANFRGAL